jgi:cytochrome c peroxidase
LIDFARYRWFTAFAAVGVLSAAVGLFAQRAVQPRAAQAAAPAAPPAPVEDNRVRLGRALFFDPSLSNPEGTSCASCHDPNQAYAGNNGSRIGAAQGSRPGHYARRNTPSVMYLRFVRRFHVVWEEDADRPELYGGFFWDGRASTIAALVREPLLHPDEMGNQDVHQIATKVAAAPYAAELAREFDEAFAGDEETLEAISFCIEAFLTSRAMAPFSSRFDDFVRGRGSLSALELRGLALFEDMEKGACAGCHRLDRDSRLPEASMFTDYGYDAVAVPRNRKLPESRDASHFDLGVCERHDARLHTEDPWFCGSFRTPSLRNVAARKSFMHNGVFDDLRAVVAFYATRATDPKRWYIEGEFDDLPPIYRENVNTGVPPYDQREGETPRLDDGEIDAIVAFLGTLSDREVPPAPRGR